MAKIAACGCAVLKRPIALLKRSFSDLKAPGHSLYTSPRKVTSKARDQAPKDKGNNMIQMRSPPPFPERDSLRDLIRL